MNTEREMTLKEWMGKLAPSHGANRELKLLEERIAELEAEIREFKNPKNWTRSYNCYGNLINSHALFLPRIKEDK